MNYKQILIGFTFLGFVSGCAPGAPALAPESLLDLQIQMTMLSGETVYCAEGADPYCP
jgi:hypothetical protein